MPGRTSGIGELAWTQSLGGSSQEITRADVGQARTWFTSLREKGKMARSMFQSVEVEGKARVVARIYDRQEKLPSRRPRRLGRWRLGEFPDRAKSELWNCEDEPWRAATGRAGRSRHAGMDNGDGDDGDDAPRVHIHTYIHTYAILSRACITAAAASRELELILL